jgi:zinc/manganese transport system permease protein
MSLHSLFLEPFSYDFMLRGLASALLLGVSGALLGCFLILRRLSLMGDALSHSLLPGVGAAFLLFGPRPTALLLGALLAGLLTAGGSALLTRLTRLKEDTSFGALFILFFGSGIALVSLARTRFNLLHFLFGNILGVSPEDLLLTGSISLLTLCCLFVTRRPLVLETFDPIFYRSVGGRGWLVHLGFLALVVLNLVAALQTMGIVLSLGLFLLPSATAFLWCQSLKKLLLLSVSLALGGSYFGILLSYHQGLPSGPAIILCLGSAFLGSALLSPTNGLLSRFLPKA